MAIRNILLSILLLAIFAAASAETHAEEKYALLVGVSEYRSKRLNEPQLKYPEEDAKSLGKVFEESGYEVDYLLGADATQENISQKLEAAKSKGDSSGVIVLGFFGHGVQYGDNAYFCPYDTSMREVIDADGKRQYEGDSTKIEPDEDSLIPMSKMLKTLKLSGAGNKLMLADCCRDDPNGARGIQARTFGGSFRYEDLPPNCATLFACSKGESAYEQDVWGHGAFTKCILDEIKLSRSLGQKVTLGSLADRIRVKVPTLVSTATNGSLSQTPRTFVSDYVNLRITSKSDTSETLKAFRRQNNAGHVPTNILADGERILAQPLESLSTPDRYRWYRLAEFCRGQAECITKSEFDSAGGLSLIDQPVYCEFEMAAYQDWPKTITDDESFNARLNFLVQKNDPRATHFAGLRYSLGIGCERDDEQAYTLFMKAREFGSAEAALSLAHIVAWGRGRKANMDLAAKFLEEAAEAGYGEAINHRFIYVDQFRDRGTYEERILNFRNAANKGSIWGGTDEASTVLNQTGHSELTEDALARLRANVLTASRAGLPKAMKLYRIHFVEDNLTRKKIEAESRRRSENAASRGIPNAMRDLSDVLISSPDATSKDNERSWKLLRTAASTGYPWARLWLARRLVSFHGDAAMHLEGLEIAKQLSDDGFFAAHFHWLLGLYHTQLEPEPRLLEKGFKAYQKAAEMDPTGYGAIGRCYRDGLGTKKDLAKAFEAYRKGAEHGDQISMYWTARNLMDGVGCAKDQSKGFYWYLRAAELDDSYGQLNVGIAFEFGKGVEKEVAKANMWYLRSAENGNEYGMWYLALNLAAGDGIAKDEKAAFRWFLTGANKGERDCANKLGDCFRVGTLGLPQDATRSFDWYMKAAELGQLDAMNRVGIAYDNGSGVKEDDAEANRWYQKAMDKGHAFATYNLGTQYEVGHGVSKDFSKALELYKSASKLKIAKAHRKVGIFYQLGNGVAVDEKEAFKWYKLAAESGIADTQYAVGTFLMNGRGVPKDQAEGAKWLERSAKAGWAQAQHELGIAYWNGTGTEKSFVIANSWFRKAADQGLAVAQHAIGTSYRDGDGIPKDLDEAKKWLKLSAENNYKPAAEALEKLRDEAAEPITTESLIEQLLSSESD